MQRKSIGHSRRKHGEHGASDFKRRWRWSPGKPGPVSSGDVLPNIGDSVTLADGAIVGRVGTVAQHWEDGPIALALVKRTVAPGVPLVAGGVDALIDPEDVVPPGPKRVYDRKQFINLRR